jgi:hypothetical protein
MAVPKKKIFKKYKKFRSFNNFFFHPIIAAKKQTDWVKKIFVNGEVIKFF